MKHAVVFSILLCSTLTACTSEKKGFTTIQNIIDPITFITEDGERIRLVGIHAPSVAGTVECYGKEALLAAESLLGKEVRLEKEPLLLEAQDGALPRYVFLTVDLPTPVQTGTGDSITEETTKEIMINERALEMGTAFPLVSEEMIYGPRLLSAARYASATKQGLWGACTVSVKDLPQGKWLSTEAITDCILKGTVDAHGKRLYRTPACSAYAETLVLQTHGEQWFCASDTAEAAGFAMAEDCIEE